MFVRMPNLKKLNKLSTKSSQKLNYTRIWRDMKVVSKFIGDFKLLKIYSWYDASFILMVKYKRTRT